MSKQDFDKIGKMLADTGNTKLKEFDIVFLIDATGSMESYIEAAKCTAEDLSKILRQKFPETNFQYGYVFYRDPIDSFEDIHEIINLTDNVNSLPQKIGKIEAYLISKKSVENFINILLNHPKIISYYYYKYIGAFIIILNI